MTPKNDSFFDAKKEWSKIKDKLLGDYLVPYFQKILTSGKPLIYIDGFAGRGRFDNGEDGSPLIALNAIKEVLERTRAANPKVLFIFIEKKEGALLRKNTESYTKIKNLKIQIIDGTFEDSLCPAIDQALHYMSVASPLPQWHKANKVNLFLYVDPYGVKALNFDVLTSFARIGFHSVEVLLNFNSFGFVREACRICGKDGHLVRDFPDLDENTDAISPRLKGEMLLTKILGGPLWKDRILKIKKGESALCVEQEIIQIFCNNLRNSYHHVLNLPIKSSDINKPLKYRMIHMTQHRDGGFLMLKDMWKRWEEYIDSQAQSSFWRSMPDGKIELDENEVVKHLVLLLKTFSQEVHLYVFVLKFYSQYGIVCSPKLIIDILSTFEKEKKIIVRRTSPKKNHKKPLTFWNLASGKTLHLRLNDDGNSNS